MVLTRHQEQMLMRQYNRILDENGHITSSPDSKPRETTLPDGRRLKSALKSHSKLRPWESDDEEYHQNGKFPTEQHGPDSAATHHHPPHSTPSSRKAAANAQHQTANGTDNINCLNTPSEGGQIKKRVTIRSNANMVHLFEKEPSYVTQSDTVEDIKDRELSAEEYYYSGGGTGSILGRIIKGIVTPSPTRRLPSPSHRAHGTAAIENTARAVQGIITAVCDFSTQKNNIIALLAILTWAISSSWLIFINRDLMRYKGFPLPLMLPALSQLVSAGFAWGMGYFGLIAVRPYRFKQTFILLFPLAFNSVACMALGNTAYMGLSVAFLNILKALTPAATLLISAFLGTESFTTTTFCSTLLIAYGTGIATVQETVNNPTFHWPSFIAFTSSILFEGLRVAIAAMLLGSMSQPYNPIEMLAHLGPMVFALLGGISLIIERNQLMAITADAWARLLPELGLVCCLSFLVNVSSYYAIKYTSSTTFKVVGCFKNAMVIWLSMLQGDAVTRRQWEGFSVSTAGFLLYTWARGRMQTRSQKDNTAENGIGGSGKDSKKHV